MLAVLDSACAASSKNDMDWTFARYSVTTGNAPKDSAGAEDFRLLRRLAGMHTDTVRADVNGHYSIGLSAGSHLLAFAQIDIEGHSYQWWKPITVAPARTMKVDLTPADVRETQFCRSPAVSTVSSDSPAYYAYQ